MTIKHENLPSMQSLSLFLTKLIAIYYIRSSNSDDFFKNIHCMLGNFSCFYCGLLTFFKNYIIFFFKRFFFRNTIRVSNGLDPYQDRHSVGPDLGPKPFAKVISRQQKVVASKERVNSNQKQKWNLFLPRAPVTFAVSQIPEWGFHFFYFYTWPPVRLDTCPKI